MAGLATTPGATRYPGARTSPRAWKRSPAWIWRRVAAAFAVGVDRSWVRPLVVFFVLKQLLFITLFAPFTGHDEVDHYWYIARLGSGDGLGVVGEVTLPAETRPYRGYVADYPSNAEVIQPPLYHAVLAPVWLVLPGDSVDRLVVLRFFSVVVGLFIVVLAYLTARQLFPESPFIRAGVPFFVALQPQLSFEAAIVNHDILVIALCSWLIYLLLRGLDKGFTTKRELGIGLVAAAGLWTKLSFGLVLPVIALAVGWAWWERRRQWGDALRSVQWLAGSLFLTTVLPLLLLTPWFVRSYWLYGDPTGSRRLSEIREFGSSASSYRQMFTTPAFWRERLEDFWGNYGWRNIPFDAVTSQSIWFIWGAALAMAVILTLREVAARLFGWQAKLAYRQVRGMTVVAASVALLAYGVLYVGTIQFTQSRFIFPGMIGIALLTLIGVDRFLPIRWRPMAVPLLLTLLVALNALTLVRFVIPFYYGPGGGGVLLP